MRNAHWPLFAGSLILLFAVSGCIWIFRSPDIKTVAPPAAEASPVVVESPVRAHLLSGRTVLFPLGAEFTAGEITSLGGTGELYDLDYEKLSPVTSILMDSIAAVETYSTNYNIGASFLVSVLATAGGFLGGSGLAVAIFGSCPTIYSDSPDGPVLEAEAFSNSIVSLFEMRDVDPLGVQASAEGVVSLEVRNEALETHYINHLELLEVQHADGALVLPAPEGQAFVVADMSAPTRAVDRAGRNVRSALANRDEEVFSTAPQTLEAASADDLFDYIDLVFPAPATDTAAVVMRLRNSLLNTVYFYDFMLAGQGSRSLDWLGRDLESLSYAVGIGDFYAQYMGLRVQVWDGEAYQEVGKMVDVGPIAWDEVAMPVAVPETDSLRLRLHFVADSWRIDEVALAASVATVTPRRVALQDIRTSASTVPSDPVALAAAPDEDYLITMPGTRFWARFEVGPEPEQGSRSFLVATQGYYTEWIRRDWLDEPTSGETFTPSKTTLHAAMQRWQTVKPAFEANFETSKIPVR